MDGWLSRANAKVPWHPDARCRRLFPPCLGQSDFFYERAIESRIDCCPAAKQCLSSYTESGRAGAASGSEREGGDSWPAIWPAIARSGRPAAAQPRQRRSRSELKRGGPRAVPVRRFEACDATFALSVNPLSHTDMGKHDYFLGCRELDLSAR